MVNSKKECPSTSLSKENTEPTGTIRIKVDDGKPIIKGIPEENTVLFFAKINSKEGFCVIYGPPETCLPQDYTYTELFDAKIAIGKENSELQVNKVRHGHKYADGGGFVEFGEGPIFYAKQIFFRQDDEGKSTYRNEQERLIQIEEVYTAL